MTDTVSEIFELFRASGDQAYFGEAVSQTEHALQTAALAEQFGAPPHLVVASLLHDIGHLLHGLGEGVADEELDARHEAIGARWLADRFPEDVCAPVRLHVAAKRYLCAVEPAYAAALSPASKQSLRLQGGPLSEDQAARFILGRFGPDAVLVRRWDDKAKVPGLPTPGLDHFKPYLAVCAMRSD
ncbi:HD domain-containing protein [Skermanella sp. TT6]|uniref:HD domain-containing protein n=1 Tax=Skermanella cutis TaxID=2775420 RepID=A0ABX7B4I3_9PROT|nr:phosphonate degradation HD-domain oxygenase [Skermanella sp. TT6]QQP89242.1 HD domain-containing protein [Skermanella sp. TT6]